MPLNPTVEVIKAKVNEPVEIEVAKEQTNLPKTAKELQEMILSGKDPKEKLQIIFELKGMRKPEFDNIIKDELNRLWDLKQSQARAQRGVTKKTYDTIINKMNDILRVAKTYKDIPTNPNYINAIDLSYKDFLMTNMPSSAQQMTMTTAKKTKEVLDILNEEPIDELIVAVQNPFSTSSQISESTTSTVKTLVEEYKKADEVDRSLIIIDIMKELNDPIFEAILKAFRYMNYEELAIILNANKKVILGLVSVIVLALVGSGGSGAVIKAVIDLIISQTKKEVIKENPSNIKLIAS